MKIYGYVRVSTMKQSIKRQIENIKDKYPDATIFTDEYTGTTMSRPKWDKLYKAAKPGDVIVFDSVSRMSRDAEEGFKVYEELFQRGVELIFLNEPHINTRVYKDVAQAPQTGDKDLDETLIRGLNEYLMRLAQKQIYLAFDQSEKEVEDLHKRTREGIREKKKRNAELMILFPETYKDHPDYRQIGQEKSAKLTTKKSIKSKEIIRKHSKDFDGTLNDIEVMKLTGLARGTFYKYKRELKEECSSSVPDEIRTEIRDQIWKTDISAYTYVTNDPELEQSFAEDYEKVHEAFAAYTANPTDRKRKTWEKRLDALIAEILKRHK